MSSARVMGTCFAIGEAAGVAAALAISERVRPGDLDVGLLREKLKAVGVPF